MLKFQEVGKAFPDGTTALEDVSFVVKPGEFVFLTGPSGSGKTTIMRLITKEYTPTAGDIIYNDYSLAQLKNSQLPQHRRQIGVVFQDFQLLSDLKAWENIALSLEIAGLTQKEISDRIQDLLPLVGLEDKAFLFPKQLSGGEAQRVGIARALASGPAMIFADEPTGNLDTKTSQDIFKLLKKINDLGTTVIVATHDQGMLEQYQDERRLEINEGKLTHDSRPPKPDPEEEKSTQTKKSVSKKANDDQSQEDDADHDADSDQETSPAESISKETPIQEELDQDETETDEASPSEAAQVADKKPHKKSKQVKVKIEEIKKKDKS